MTRYEILADSAASDVDVEMELDLLAARYRAAGGVGIEVLNMLGGQAEALLDKLPAAVQAGLGGATEKALRHAMKAAHGSRRLVGDQSGWLNNTVAAALGAVGGAGGMPTALAELPVTTTVLLRAIQGVAVKHGFDPALETVQFDCIQVFSAAGPMTSDDGADLAFVSARLAVSGAAMQALVARVAPKLATVLGQKLAAQAVPIVGAVAGAATNYAYTSYYQEIAHVHFGLRKLAIDTDTPHPKLVEGLLDRIAPIQMPATD